MFFFDDDSDRDLESSYADSIHDDHDDSDIATPSPTKLVLATTFFDSIEESSSQDEYFVTPTKNEPSSLIYSTPTSYSAYTEKCARH